MVQLQDPSEMLGGRDQLCYPGVQRLLRSGTDQPAALLTVAFSGPIAFDLAGCGGARRRGGDYLQ